MPGINILKHEKFHSIGTNFGGPSLEELKVKRLIQVLSLEPILARGHFDHLIQFKKDIDPPTLEWKKELLEQASIDYLYSVNTICEKIREEQIRRY